MSQANDDCEAFWLELLSQFIGRVHGDWDGGEVLVVLSVEEDSIGGLAPVGFRTNRLAEVILLDILLLPRAEN